MERITSRQNAVVARYRAAARGEARDVLLLDGAHLINDAIAAGITLRHALVAADAIDAPEIAGLLRQLRTADVASASAMVMDAASPVRSSSPIVALGERPAQAQAPYDGDSPFVVVACNLQDPGNLGAIVRVAEGAGASGVVVAGQSADPYGWKALRGSMGSALRMPISIASTIEAAVEEARAQRAQILATIARDGRSLFESDLTGPCALFIGGEGPGLPPHVVDAADVRITIPMETPVESLNAAVAAAVVLYEARRQRDVGSKDPTRRSAHESARTNRHRNGLPLS